MGRNVVILGSQWGDEGKGKIVDLLTDKASVVARFQGATMPVILWLLTVKKQRCISFLQGFFANMLTVSSVMVLWLRPMR